MSEENDGVDVKPLLNAAARRGVTQPGDPRIGLFETLRQTATWTGQVYEAQLVTLKRNAMLIMGSKVVLGVDTDKQHVTYSGGPAPRGFERTLEDVQQMMEALVCQVLGPKWTVDRGTINQDDPRPASKGRKPAKSKGKRSARKARKR